jgi:hypothetical protein
LQALQGTSQAGGQLVAGEGVFAAPGKGQWGNVPPASTRRRPQTRV